MFCENCGSPISEGEQFCANCGAPVKTAVQREPENKAGNMSPIPPGMTPEEPSQASSQGKPNGKPQGKSKQKSPKGEKGGKSRESLIIALVCAAAALIMGFLGVAGYGLVKTKEFKETMAVFAEVQTEYDGLGNYESGYDGLLDTADAAASHFRFWQYKRLIGEMEDLSDEIRKAGKAVAGYREQYEEIVSQMETDGQYIMGDYEEEYQSIKSDLEDALSDLDEKKSKSLVEEMDTLSGEIRSMNEAVAGYRTQYEEIVSRMETEGHYFLDDHETEYQQIKSDLEAALSAFDEKKCESLSGDFAAVRDVIIADNEAKASAYVSDAQSIRSAMGGYAAHPFEAYMIGDCVDGIEASGAEQDYVQLRMKYLQLKEWSDRFQSASRAGEQIASFIQADVSGENEVKLYLSSYHYDEYDFQLNDFMVYEENGGTWSQCNATGITQIRGSLTMDLVADVSSSMFYDFITMQEALEGFVDSTHADTQLGLSTIGSIYERHQEFTSDKERIIDAVWGLACYGRTSLYQSLYSSVVYTASAEGARCVVAFTDGHNEPYGSGYDYNAQDVIDVSNYYKVPVYIIGLGNSVYSSELKNIAESTGGAYYDRVSIYDLQSIYTSIYEAQGKLYELTYQTVVPNDVNRDIYVLYADDTANLSVRLETELNAEALQQAYASSMFSADDLSSFYTDGRYLSSDDLSKLGDDLEAVQTIINIYYAMNGYQFGDGENGQKQLAKMISLGVVSGNGTLDGDTVSEIIRANPVLYQNFSALYNYRYELVFSAAYDIYWNNPSISYEDLRGRVHRYFGESNETRFDPVTKAAWNAIKAG
ncbi:MAG: VWA domain-containing protein [Blautia sp.]|nr:VWA domain-containing protein [Blautia sp.]